MNKYWISASVTGIALLGGLYIGKGQNDLQKALGFGIGGSLLIGAPMAFYYDTKYNAQKRIVQDLQGNVSRINDEVNREKNLKLKAENLKLQALDQMKLLKSELDIIKNSEVNLTSEVQTLQRKVDELVEECSQLRTENADKEAELQEFANDYDKNLAEDFEAKKRELVAVEIAKEFELTAEAFQIMDEMQAFVKQVYERHQGQRQELLGTNGKYHEHLDKMIERHNQAYFDLEQVRNSLELRVRILEQTIKDGLVQPEHGDYGIGSLNGRIVNHIVDWVWANLEIPLKALGLDDSEELVIVGLSYAKSQEPASIVARIQARKKDICNFLGIYEITSVIHDQISDTIFLRFRRERPKPPTDEEIYKNGLIPASQFSHQIFLATDHTAKGKPTMRVMSSTGGGKGIAVKNVLAYFAELDDWEVWLSDPVDGSEEDYWNCPKIARSPSEAGKAYQQFTKLHRARQKKESALTDKYVIGVFDEFDRQHDDDDKETAKTIMTAIRHTKQRQILIGQSGEVGENHWTWDAMNNCALLFIENAIGTAIKHDKDLGWSLAKKREVQKKYEKFAQWAQLKNEAGNIPNENAYRIALLVIGDRYSFLEIPSAHKGIIKSGKAFIRDTFDATVKQWTEINHPDELTETKIVCPHCASDAVSRNGKNRLGEQLYSCKVCEGKPKKWLFPNSN